MSDANTLAGFTYEYVPHGSPRTLLLLHGTGGNERDMLTFGAQLDASADLLSPRGNVTENGMARYFKRFAEGLLDRKDLAARSEELAGFIAAASEKYALKEIVGVGFSNGANILLHLICMHPEIVKAAMLLRPMSASLPDTIERIPGLPVFVGAGSRDEVIPQGDAEHIGSVLKAAGADVTLRITPEGHRLGTHDVELAREWLAGL